MPPIAAAVTFFYSTDGSAWTSVAAGDIASASLPVSVGAIYDFNPSGVPSAANAGVISKTSTANGVVVGNKKIVKLVNKMYLLP